LDGPTGKIVTLESGVGVELVAVGVAPTAKGSNWWSQSGDVLPEPPARVRNEFYRPAIEPGDSYLARSIFIRLHSPVDADASTTGFIVDATGHLNNDLYHHGRDTRSNDTHLTAQAPAAGQVYVKLPRTEASITYRFGVAAGPWETIATVNKASVMDPSVVLAPPQSFRIQSRIELDPTQSFTYVDSHENWHTHLLPGIPIPLGDVARRVIALDERGKEVALDREASGYTSEGVAISQELLARIAVFQIQTRPYQWAEFRDIALQPNARILPFVASPPSIPAYTHMFACGVRMELPAVALPKYGGLFWRPDGKVVPGPLKEYATTLDFAWDGSTPLVLFRRSANHLISYSTAFEFVPPVPHEEGVRQESFEQQLQPNRPYSSLLVPYYWHNMPREMTIRYGISSGPWKTAGRVTMPTDIRHDDNIPSFNGNEMSSDVKIKIAQNVEMSYLSGSGQPQSISFLPTGTSIGSDAVRIIGIDKLGKSIPIYSLNEGHTMNGNLILLSFHQVGPLYNRNQFDLSTIKEFRLQTRSYEWAEFKHIHLAPK
jgi:hypothetical protein